MTFLRKTPRKHLRQLLDQEFQKKLAQVQSSHLDRHVKSSCDQEVDSFVYPSIPTFHAKASSPSPLSTWQVPLSDQLIKAYYYHKRSRYFFYTSGVHHGFQLSKMELSVFHQDSFDRIPQEMTFRTGHFQPGFMKPTQYYGDFFWKKRQDHLSLICAKHYLQRKNLWALILSEIPSGFHVITSAGFIAFLPRAFYQSQLKKSSSPWRKEFPRSKLFLCRLHSFDFSNNRFIITPPRYDKSRFLPLSDLETASFNQQKMSSPFRKLMKILLSATTHHTHRLASSWHPVMKKQKSSLGLASPRKKLSLKKRA